MKAKIHSAMSEKPLTFTDITLITINNCGRIYIKGKASDDTFFEYTTTLRSLSDVDSGDPNHQIIIESPIDAESEGE